MNEEKNGAFSEENGEPIESTPQNGDAVEPVVPLTESFSQDDHEPVTDTPPRVVSSVEYGPERQSSDKRRGGNAWRAVALTLSIIFLVFSLFVGAGILLGRKGTDGNAPNNNNADGTPVSPNNNVIMQETDATAGITSGDVSEIFAKCADTVVEIITTTDRPAYGSVQSGAGSGVIIGVDREGTGTYIVTNNHVIEGSNVSSITVRTTAGEEFDAEVIGADWVSDIAVLRIEKTGLKSAVWASSKNLRPGQSIIAIGNPLGSLGGSVSRGIISGVERTITVEGVPMTLLQIDAAINPGNSGGGLFDMNGNLVGIVNAKSVATDVEGIGFAIPADSAKEIAVTLAEKGYVPGRADLGLSLGSVSSYGIQITESLYTDEIEIGDYLYALTTGDGKTVQITSLDAYKSVLVGLEEGDTVTATVCHLRSAGIFVQTKTYEVALTVKATGK